MIKNKAVYIHNLTKLLSYVWNENSRDHGVHSNIVCFMSLVCLLVKKWFPLENIKPGPEMQK